MQLTFLKSPEKNRWRHNLWSKEEEGSNKSDESVLVFFPVIKIFIHFCWIFESWGLWLVGLSNICSKADFGSKHGLSNICCKADFGSKYGISKHTTITYAFQIKISFLFFWRLILPAFKKSHLSSHLTIVNIRLTMQTSVLLYFKQT